MDAIPSLLIPVLVLGSIYGGICTPTEAAAFACFVGIIISCFVYKEVKISELPYLGFRAVMLCTPVLFVIGMSSGFGKVLAIADIPTMIAEAILGLTTNKILLLLLINILLLFVGAFMETNAAIIILTPILLPIVKAVGVSPVHFGMIMILNLGFVKGITAGLNSFTLAAVPLFTFAGDIMGKGGISRRLLDLGRIVFDRFTGGLGMVAIVACMFFAAISGTGSATVAAIGLIMIPVMVNAGYDKPYSASLVATAGTIGTIIPPSVCMVVYASVNFHTKSGFKKINTPKTKIITPPLIDHNIGVPPVIQVQFVIDFIILYYLSKR